MSPDFLFIVAYITLTWKLYTVQIQAQTRSDDEVQGHTDGKIKLFIIVVAFCFLIQMSATCAYLFGDFTSLSLINVLTFINIVLPIIILSSIMKTNCGK